MELTSKKVFMIAVMALCIILLGALLIGCTDKEKKQAIEKYGQAKAYNKTSTGNIIHLSGTISYYIPTSVTGDYRSISEYAIAKANTLTDAVVVNTASIEGTYKFAQTGTIPTSPNANANNSYTFYTDTGVISGSTITYSTDHLNGKNYAYKKHTALHEMGHSFGLKHIEADVMRGYTVMISPHPNEEKYQVADYTEFDRYNIEWYYGK